MDIKVDISKMILSSKCRVFVLDSFVKTAHGISKIDYLLTKVSEGIISNLDRLNLSGKETRFNLKIKGLELGIDCVIVKKDSLFEIVWVGLLGDAEIRQNDQRVVKLLNGLDTILFEINPVDKQSKIDYSKMYILTSIGDINMPNLDSIQQQIVEIEDKNVVVHGVAGSGKTNICIDKLIYVAGRNYGGKTLYTTYSRGLLNATRLRVTRFANELESFVDAYSNRNVIFRDGDHKRAVQNRFGLTLNDNDESKIVDKIKSIISYLKNKVEYVLVDDLYKRYIGGGKRFVGETYFVNTFVKSIKSHQVVSAIKKLSDYSYEVIFKEIYGIILGYYDLDSGSDILSLDKYIEIRRGSISSTDCASIHLVATEYLNHCRKNNLIDYNMACRELLGHLDCMEKYSLAIIDEVQDYTQVNLNLFKSLSLKCYCVGDALQMINPSYFSFGYLKNLLYEEDVVSVAELKYNYRNSQKIARIIDSLGEENVKLFGTHNFVLRGNGVGESVSTNTIFVNSDNMVEEIAKGKFDNFTIVVSDVKKKDKLRGVLKNQEILTVSEIKGLERDTVVLIDVLSDNVTKWNHLSKASINRKVADENSVYRYYFNLFYVGVSRAKQNLFVVERECVNALASVFKDNFDILDTPTAIERLGGIVSKLEYSQEEIVARIKEFVLQGQYDNAEFLLDKIADDYVRSQELRRIEINKTYVIDGKHRDAGIEFWQVGLMKEARDEFLLSGDKALIELIDACESKGSNGLSIDVVQYFPLISDNKVACKLILDILRQDSDRLKNSFKASINKFKQVKGGKNG